MDHDHQPRSILIIDDERSIRKVLYVLRAGLGWGGDIAHNGYQALAMVEEEAFDVVLLDLHYSEMPVGEMAPAIRELRPNLVGRALVIAGDVSDPQTMETIKKCCWSYVDRQHLVPGLWERLRCLLGFSHSRQWAVGSRQ